MAHPITEGLLQRVADLEAEVERLQGQFSLAYIMLVSEHTRDLADLLDSEARGEAYDADAEEYK